MDLASSLDVSGKASSEVLFVHGHGGDPWRFDPMRKALEDQGYRTYVMEFPSMEEDMGWLSWWVKSKVGAIKRERGVEKVDLVCHSMGGLIARHYVRFLDGERHLKHFVTLATPNHGVPFAAIPLFPRFMISERLRRQVEPKSDFLKTLNQGDPTPGNVPYTSIGSHQDRYVPIESSKLDGATNFAIKGPTHTSIMFDPVPVKLVSDALAAPFQ